MTNQLMPLIFPLIFLAGFIDSIAGGGGIISLTAYMAIGLPTHMALGTNKFSSTVGTTISTWQFARKGHIRWGLAILSSICALVGASFGSRIAIWVDERTLRYLVVGLAPLVAVFLIFKKDFGETSKQLSSAKTIAYSVIIGLLIGAYDGFFGPGAGTFLIIAFTQVIGLSVLTACGNAKLVNLASNVAALFTYVLNGNVYYQLAIPCALCGILGNYLGAGLTMKRGARIVRPMMVAVVVLLLAKIVWDLV